MSAVSAIEANAAVVPLPAPDEDLAGHSAARVLISASTGSAVETIARRLHAASPRTALPFVRTTAGELPV